GKTTIGRAIAGLTKVTGGSLQVHGTEMNGVKEKAFRPVRERIGFVFRSRKTPIGRAIAGLTKVTGGSLQVHGTEMNGVKEKAFRPVRERIGFVFQDPASSF